MRPIDINTTTHGIASAQDLMAMHGIRINPIPDVLKLLQEVIVDLGHKNLEVCAFMNSLNITGINTGLHIDVDLHEDKKLIKIHTRPDLLIECQGEYGADEHDRKIPYENADILDPNSDVLGILNKIVDFVDAAAQCNVDYDRLPTPLGDGNAQHIDGEKNTK